MTDINKKLKFSSLGALLFLATSLPSLYAYTNKYTHNEGNCPTYTTKLLHVVVFFVLNLLAMRYMGDLEWDLSAKYALYGSLVFFLLSSTEMYKLTNNLISTSNEVGCPNMTGLLVHTVVYGVVLLGLMSLPKDKTQ
jgi:hypothetical protein